MKRVLLAIAFVVAFSSNALAENVFDHKNIESVCASIQSGKSPYNLSISGSIQFFAFIRQMTLTKNPTLKLKISAIAARKSENDKNCPEMNSASIYKIILNKGFTNAYVPIVKNGADAQISAIARVYDSVKEENYDCEKISGFVIVPNFFVLACDKNSRFYSLNANYPIVKFCGSSLNDKCFR